MRLYTRAIVALLAGSLLLVGCSDDSGSSDGNGGGDKKDVVEDTTGGEDDTTTDEDTADDEDSGTDEDTGPDEDTSDMDASGDSGADAGDTGDDGGGGMDADGGTDADTTVSDTTGDTTVSDTAGDTTVSDTSGDTVSDTTISDTSNDAADGDTVGDTSLDIDIPDVDVGPGSDYTIRQIRTLATNLPPGQSLPGTYTVNGVVVTAVRGSTGVFVQEPTGPKPNSGIFIYFGNTQSGVTVPSNISPGTVLDLEGRVKNFDDNSDTTNGGLLELDNLASISIANQNGTVPNPVQITNPAEIGTYNGTVGSKAESLESVLVEVSNVHVIDSNPDGPSDDFKEFVVGSSSGASDGVRVDDLLYKYGSAPRNLDPSSGDQFTTIVGPLGFTYDDTKILPRKAGDIQ